MDQPKPPAWLATFQSDFSTALLTPLDTSSGHLRAKMPKRPRAIDQAVVPRADKDSSSQLAVYNQQYWFRLCGMMQTEFPLVARLMGFWCFNLYAMAFLRRRPPGYDSLQDIGTGFADFLVETIPAAGVTLGAGRGRLPRAAAVQAARIDRDWSKVFLSPETATWRPSESEASVLPQLQLVASPCVVLVEEHWPLLEKRAALGSEADEARINLPKALPQPQWWALQRTPAGMMARLQLLPLQAQLLGLLSRYTVADAINRFEKNNANSDLLALAEHTQAWVAQSVFTGFWCEARR